MNYDHTTLVHVIYSDIYGPQLQTGYLITINVQSTYIFMCYKCPFAGIRSFPTMGTIYNKTPKLPFSAWNQQLSFPEAVADHIMENFLNLTFSTQIK